MVPGPRSVEFVQAQQGIGKDIVLTRHILDPEIKTGQPFHPTCLSPREIALGKYVFQTLVVCHPSKMSTHRISRC